MEKRNDRRNNKCYTKCSRANSGSYNAVFYQLVGFALILAFIALLFMFLKFLIIKAIKKAKNESVTVKREKDKEGQQCYLSNEELEVIRGYNKLTEENKQEIRNKIKEYNKNRKLKI